jgi:hypothetical protein
MSTPSHPQPHFPRDNFNVIIPLFPGGPYPLCYGPKNVNVCCRTYVYPLMAQFFDLVIQMLGEFYRAWRAWIHASPTLPPQLQSPLETLLSNTLWIIPLGRGDQFYFRYKSKTYSQIYSETKYKVPSNLRALHKRIWKRIIASVYQIYSALDLYMNTGVTVVNIFHKFLKIPERIPNANNFKLYFSIVRLDRKVAAPV